MITTILLILGLGCSAAPVVTCGGLEAGAGVAAPARAGRADAHPAASRQQARAVHDRRTRRDQAGVPEQQERSMRRA
jgi:hypothetical protein